MKKTFLLVAVMAMMAMGVFADSPARVPAYRGLIERVQPNGDTLRTYLRGDEWSHFTMTEDGWQIVETKRGWLKYAKLNRKGEVVSSCRKAHNAEDRSKCEVKWLNKKGIQKTVIQ